MLPARDRRPRAFATRAVHAGEAPDPSTGAHGVPVYQNSTYAFRSYRQTQEAMADRLPHFFYVREGNPTVRTLELKLADLDGAEAAVATASGMAAISAALLHLLAGGGHLVASQDLYFAAREFVCADLPAYGAGSTLVDIGDLAAVRAAITPATRALYAETFANPGMQVADLDALAALAGEHGIPLVVDNTYLSPALLRPIERGAALVVHSTTKYLSGHGHALGGAVCGSRALVGGIAARLARLGGAPSPLQAWLTLTGTKTLPLRVERHAATALRLARFLEAHPAVAAVRYPGLASDPGHAVARRLLGGAGYGGMLAFALAGGEPAFGPFLDSLDLCTIAVSLGEPATLIWPYPAQGLLRLSVGLEDPADLEADLAQALARVPVVAAAD